MYPTFYLDASESILLMSLFFKMNMLNLFNFISLFWCRLCKFNLFRSWYIGSFVKHVLWNYLPFFCVSFLLGVIYVLTDAPLLHTSWFHRYTIDLPYLNNFKSTLYSTSKCFVEILHEVIYESFRLPIWAWVVGLG